MKPSKKEPGDELFNLVVTNQVSQITTTSGNNPNVVTIGATVPKTTYSKTNHINTGNIAINYPWTSNTLTTIISDEQKLVALIINGITYKGKILNKNNNVMKYKGITSCQTSTLTTVVSKNLSFISTGYSVIFLNGNTKKENMLSLCYMANKIGQKSKD